MDKKRGQAEKKKNIRYEDVASRGRPCVCPQ